MRRVACGLIVLVGLLLGGVGVGVAAPGDGPGESYSVLMKAANGAYNAGDYDQAVEGYVRAIQARPAKAAPYRNLARTYFWQGEYNAAVTYYDIYLRLAPEADDREQIRSERRLASSRGGDEPFTAPEAQRLALQAFEDQLQEGAAYTKGGGGAWGSYQTLLRTGYARPDLTRLRSRLVQRLLDEFEGLLVPAQNQPTPQLGLEEWQLQQRRLDAATRLSDDEAIAEIIARRAKIADAAVALLNGLHQKAVELGETAIEQNPDMGFMRWLHVNALVETGEHQAALDALQALRDKLAQTAPNQLGYAKVLEASILQRMGRSDQAADLYLGLVSE